VDDDPTQHPARLEIVHQLQRAVLEVYGEERAGEPSLRPALEAAATALWRVLEEPLAPEDDEPLAIPEPPGPSPADERRGTHG
jgi:hypothetical protein